MSCGLYAINMANPIFQLLTNQAEAIVSVSSQTNGQALKYTLPSLPTLQPFVSGGLGNFPFYWQDPSNLLFNINTYNWINANLMAGANPVRQALGSSFTNLFIDAMGSISYFLSTQDQANLTQASNNITIQQQNVLSGWQSAYGNIPPGSTPIDGVINVICTTWASPAITFQALQSASNVATILNTIPPSGMSILPLLINYINALNKYVSLSNASSENTGYLNSVLSALQNPSTNNGGLTANDHNIYPAYQINTPLQDILSGLGADNAITLNLSVQLESNNDLVQVTTVGTNPFGISLDELIVLNLNSNPTFLQNILANATQPTDIEVVFRGVTMVYFSPNTFNPATNQNWCWIPPIAAAINNGNNDVTGFKFSPATTIDFSINGPFALLSAVAISNLPSISLTITTPDYQSISKTVNTSSLITTSLLGVPLAENSIDLVYNCSATPQSATGTVTIFSNVNPSPNSFNSVSTNSYSLNSLGWVHGVIPNYPLV
jgi:hypothetical protein